MRSYYGTYSVSGTHVIESDDLKLISSMLDTDLYRIASNPDTWETLYFCTKDQSYWLLSYEHPEIHGGGIKVLNEISEEDAIAFKKKIDES
jgi:hypothetical protein